MRLLVTGLRGFPNILGGIESHCENLYPLLDDPQVEIALVRRARYVTDDSVTFSGVKFVDLWSPRSGSLETIVHTFLSILYGVYWRADIIHIHAIGPGLLAPMARLLGMKVVLTHHGADYERQKWGRLAKRLLRWGELLGCRWADRRIAISKHIQQHIRNQTSTEAVLITNGAKQPTFRAAGNYLRHMGLEPRQYALCVARFVPEKGLHDLIQAQRLLDQPMPIVIAGDADHESPYSRDIKALAADTHDVVLTGFIKGDELAEVFSNAKIFVLPSYHEGLPIALLEAMSFGLDPLVSSIPAHTEVGLPSQCYFQLGDTEDLATSLDRKTNQTTPDISAESLQKLLDTDYNWEATAKQTLALYWELFKRR